MQTKQELIATITRALVNNPEFNAIVEESCEPCNAALYTYVTDELRQQYTDEQWADITYEVWEAMCDTWDAMYKV